MDIHEYQAKEILKEHGIKIPTGAISYSPEQAVYRAHARYDLVFLKFRKSVLAARIRITPGKPNGARDADRKPAESRLWRADSDHFAGEGLRHGRLCVHGYA